MNDQTKTEQENEAYISPSVLNGGLERATIKKALLHEAAQWSGDHKTSVWSALCSTAKNMGISLTKDECYQAMKRSNVKLTDLPLTESENNDEP